MLDKEQIETLLRTSLVDKFEVPADDIHHDARLYEDLDIDSLDAVDLVLELQEATGVKVKPEEFRSARTVADVVDAVHALTEAEAAHCS